MAISLLQLLDFAAKGITLSDGCHYNSLLHSCQLLLGVNLSLEFVNLYFPYAGLGLLFSAGGSGILNSNWHVWQWKEEAMLCEIHMCDFKSHFQQDFLA